MKSYVIHFIRNMPCEGNLEGRYIGRTQSPLADSSIRELLELKRCYQYPQAQAFYASPATRCVDTLRLLYPQADPEVVLDLAECDFGDWEGKTAQELQDDLAFLAWMDQGGQAAPPNGESGLVFLQRVCRGFEDLVRNLLAKGQTSAALCAPAGVITGILSAYGLPRAQPYEWMMEPGCGYSVRITPSLWMRGNVAEVFATLPQGEAGEGPDHFAVDIAREAAERAWGGESWRGGDSGEPGV